MPLKEYMHTQVHAPNHAKWKRLLCEDLNTQPKHWMGMRLLLIQL